MFSGSVYGDFFAFRPQTGLWVGGWVPPIPQTFFGTNNNSERVGGITDRFCKKVLEPSLIRGRNQNFMDEYELY